MIKKNSTEVNIMSANQMALKLRLSVFAVLCVAASGVFAQDSTVTDNSANTDSIKSDIQRERILRQYADKNADELVKDANAALASNKYEQAIDCYLAAKAKLSNAGNSSYVQDKLTSIDASIAQTYLYWSQDIVMQAEKAVNAQDYDKAIELCKKASEIYPADKKKLDAKIADYKHMKEVVTYRSQVTESAADPKKEERDYKIDLLMKQGKVLYADKQYDKARDKFEEVLILNPYNSDAIDAIRKANLKILEIGNKRTDTIHNERVSEIEWNMVTPLIPKTGDKDELGTGIIKKDDVENQIQKKLREIVIPRLEFEEVTVTTVVKYLKMISREIDPEKTGVNIFLRLTAPKTGEAAEGAEAAPVAEPTITMVVDNIPLGEAIRYVCRAGNLKYRIEKFAVVLASNDVPLDEVETRIYPLEQEAIETIGGAQATPEVVKEHFERRGITFPTGAQIVYDSNISRLIATNTPDNLAKIEEIIKEINVVDPQVLIQAKFVEVKQNDLEELGFEYQLARGQGTGDTHPDRHTFLANNANLTRSVGQNGIGNDIGQGYPDRMLTYHGVSGGGYTFDMTVHALDQLDSSDVLSSPRVTTMNGQEATIRMVSQWYLPEEWSEPESTTVTNGNSTQYASVPSIPTFGETTDDGIVLRVTPNVDPDHYTITLQMNPVVQSIRPRTDWDDYSFEITIDGTHYDNTLVMPIIDVRQVETTVSCYDGETIILGGIIKDQVDVYNDKYPFLGDLPLIGRAFQSQAKRATKVNLLIFMTCRLVNPDGSPIREREMRGLPPFRN